MTSNPGRISAALAPYASATPPSQTNVVSLATPAHWFGNLRPDEKVDVVLASLNALDNRTSDPRERWLQTIFAVADAGRLGCPGARELALAWSQRGASWSGESDFDTAWNSFKPNAGTTVGSLLAAASNAGADLSRWRNVAFARAQQVGSSAVQQTAGASTTAAIPYSIRSVPLASLPLVPRKRQWLHGSDLIRGALTLLIAPGGRAKSTWLLTCALACASARALLGSHVFGGPLRVLCLSTEDGLSELALRLRASMKHHKLTDTDVPGLHVIGADRWGLPLLQIGAAGPMLDRRGLDALIAELDHTKADVLIIDPLINIMGGVNSNDNSAAALLMGQLVEIAAKRGISIALAHHASKGRDPKSPDSAMGAATFVNLARIVLSIETLDEKDAGKIGLAPWDAKSVFRVGGTKQNFSAPNTTDRWFRVVSVDMPNAEPPIYVNGDQVAVVEVLQPGVSGPTFPHQMVRDALLAIDGASPPLTPSKRSPDRCALPVLANAIAAHRGGRASETEGKAVLDHLIIVGLVHVDDVKVPRAGKGSDTRKGLALTVAGKAAVVQPASPAAPNNPTPQPPQSPATSSRDDAGGEPPGSPAMPGGCGGNAGGPEALQAETGGAAPSAGQSSGLVNELSQNDRDGSPAPGEHSHAETDGRKA